MLATCHVTLSIFKVTIEYKRRIRDTRLLWCDMVNFFLHLDCNVCPILCRWRFLRFLASGIPVVVSCKLGRDTRFQELQHLVFILGPRLDFQQRTMPRSRQPVVHIITVVFLWLCRGVDLCCISLGYFINIHIMYILDKVDLRVYVNLECYIGTHIKTEHLWAVGMGDRCLYVHLLRKVRQEDCELEVSLDSKSPVTWAEETAQWAEHWLWSWAEEIKHWLCDHRGL